jgi:hypothetical protein
MVFLLRLDGMHLVRHQTLMAEHDFVNHALDAGRSGSKMAA